MTSTNATEATDGRYAGLDTWSDDAILGALLEGQQQALCRGQYLRLPARPGQRRTS
jgi:hypothetical protein